MAWDHFDEAGDPRNPTACNGAATTMLDQLAWWATTLRTARRADEAILETAVS
jgi:hypothetical protein